MGNIECLCDTADCRREGLQVCAKCSMALERGIGQIYFNPTSLSIDFTSFLALVTVPPDTPASISTRLNIHLASENSIPHITTILAGMKGLGPSLYFLQKI